MPIHYITNSFTVVDGFVVHKIDNNQFIRNINTRNNSITSEIRRKIAIHEVINLEELFNSYTNTAVIPITSEAIFTVMNTAKIDFVKDENDNVFTKFSEMGKSAVVVDSFSLDVISVRVGRVTKYLYHQPPNDIISLLDKVTVKADIKHAKDISFFQAELQLKQFNFTEGDILLLNSLYVQRLPVCKKVLELFVNYYQIVKSGNLATVFVPTFDGNTQTFPKDLQYGTVVAYGRDATFMILLMMNFSKLSFSSFENIAVPPLQLALDAVTPALLSDYFIDILSDDKYLVFWMTLVKLCAFDWSKQTQVTRSEVNYRHVLDAIKAFATYAVMFRTVETESATDMKLTDIFFNNKYRAWVWTKNIYSKLVQVSAKYEATQVTLVDDESVSIHGKTFSKSYIKIFYKNMEQRFTNNLNQLKEFYTNVVSVEDVAKRILYPLSFSVAENRLEPKDSIIDLFNENVRKTIYPVRKESAKNIKDTILKLVSDMGVCLMWMVYLDTSGPARFPELAVLKYAGNDRNIFFNANTKTIEIHFFYAKSRSFPVIIRSLDKITTEYLLHYIFVERFIMRETLSTTYAGASRDLFNEMSEEDKLFSFFYATSSESGITDIEYSDQVCQSFLFFNPVSGALISRNMFAKFYNSYPIIDGFGPEQRLNMREMRQCIVSLMRNCVPVVGRSTSISAAIEMAAGHSPNVALAQYGVDRFAGLGARSTLDNAAILKICYSWHTWLDLDNSIAMASLMSVVENYSMFSVSGSPYDLVLAAKHIYGNNFNFKFGQERLMSTVYLANTKVIPIQAAPGYGKTLLFQVPMLAIKMAHSSERVVHFVFVPFISLMANMKERLNVQGFTASFISDVVGYDRVPDESSLTSDVYVCSYEDVNSKILLTMFSNWGYHFPNIRLGFLVIDEAHHLGRQVYRHKVSHNFMSIDYSKFAKLILLSGTVGYKSYSKHLSALNIDAPVVYDASFDSSEIYVHDLVHTVPLQNVSKQFSKVDAESIVSLCLSNVSSFIRGGGSSKVLIVCRTKADVEKLSILRFDTVVPLHVTGDDDKQYKIDTINKFVSDSSSRIMVGTCLVSEGIDVSSLGMVVLYNYIPDIAEFVQICGRLRNGGSLKCFWLYIPISDSNLAIVDPEKDINKQIAEFYGLPVPSCLTLNDKSSTMCGTTSSPPSEPTLKRPRLASSATILNTPASTDATSTQDTISRAASSTEIPLDDSEPTTELSIVGEPINDVKVPKSYVRPGSPAIPLLPDRTLFSTDHPLALRPRFQLLPVRRSFDSMSSSITPVNAIKEELQSKITDIRTIFQLLDIPVPHLKWLYFDGMNESAIANVWYPRNFNCKKCLMAPPANCICYEVIPGKRKWLKEYYVEGLLILKSILPAKEYDAICEVAATDGPHTILLNLHSNVDRYSELIKAKTNNYTSFMDLNFHNTDLNDGAYDIRDILTAYCRVWTMLKSTNADPIHFFSRKSKTYVEATLFWKNENLESSIKQQLQNTVNGYTDLPFMTENGGSSKLMLNICFGYIQERVLNYDENYDILMLDSQINDSDKVIPIPHVPVILYKLMVGCLYFNPGFQEYLKINWPEIPICSAFSQWLKFVKEKTTINNGDFKLKYYIFIVYLYLHYIEDDSSEQ